MLRRNVASQHVAAQMNSRSDGSPLTTGVSIYYTGDSGSQTSGGGTLAHKGNGHWDYIPAVGETNYDHVAFTFVHSTGVNVTMSYHPVSFNPTDAVRMGLTALPNAAADAAGGLPISDAGGLDLDAKLANTNEITAARLSELDAATSGKMANEVDLIKADAAAILADTGTDGVVVATGSKSGYSLATAPPTKAEIAAEILVTPANKVPVDGSGNVQIDKTGHSGTVTDKTGFSLVADQSGVTVGTVNALGTQAKADVNAEVDSALDTVIPGTPTPGSINAHIEDIDQRTSRVDDMIENVAGDRFTAKALEAAPDHPSVAEIAAGILTTPANLLVTDASGRAAANLTAIDGNPTNNNTATLALKKLDINNSDGTAVEIQAPSVGHGIHIHNVDGVGMEIESGVNATFPIIQKQLQELKSISTYGWNINNVATPITVSFNQTMPAGSFIQLYADTQLLGSLNSSNVWTKDAGWVGEVSGMLKAYINGSTGDFPAGTLTVTVLDGVVAEGRVLNLPIPTVLSTFNAWVVWDNNTKAPMDHNGQGTGDAISGGWATLAEIEGSTVLAKEATVDALPTLAEIEGSGVLLKSLTFNQNEVDVDINGAVASQSSGVSDWTTGEKEQIRSALGVDGTKTPATGGQLQDVPTLAEIEASTVLAKDSTVAKATDLATVDTVVDAVKVVTDKVGGLIEDVSGNRFTAKALEQAPVGGTTDWTSGEKEQIRSALGVDGTKTPATGGQLQDIPTLAEIEGSTVLAMQGDQMDLVAAPNTTAIAAIQTGNAYGVSLLDRIYAHVADLSRSKFMSAAGIRVESVVFTKQNNDTSFTLNYVNLDNIDRTPVLIGTMAAGVWTIDPGYTNGAADGCALMVQFTGLQNIEPDTICIRNAQYGNMDIQVPPLNQLFVGEQPDAYPTVPSTCYVLADGTLVGTSDGMFRTVDNVGSPEREENSTTNGRNTVIGKINALMALSMKHNALPFYNVDANSIQFECSFLSDMEITLTTGTFEGKIWNRVMPGLRSRVLFWNGTTYTIDPADTVVGLNGKTYYCIESHIASPDNEPGQFPASPGELTLWAIDDASSGGTPNWSRGTTYSSHSVVNHPSPNRALCSGDYWDIKVKNKSLTVPIPQNTPLTISFRAKDRDTGMAQGRLRIFSVKLPPIAPEEITSGYTSISPDGHIQYIRGEGRGMAIDAMIPDARPGDEMDMVDSPNATGLAAIKTAVEGSTVLAKEATVDSLPTLAEIEGSTVLAKENTVDALPTLAEIEASTVLAKESTVDALPTLTEIEGTTVLAKEATVNTLPTLVEIEGSTVLAKEASVGDLPTLAEIEGSTVLAKEATVNALPTLVEIEGSTVLAKDSTVAKSADLATVDTVVDAVKVVTDRLDTTMELDVAVYRFTQNALEQAPVGGGAADWTSGEKEQIRDALGVNGTKTTAVGGQLQDVPTLAEIEASTVLAKDSTVAKATDLATVDTVVDGIKVKTDQLVFTIPNQVDANALSGGAGGATLEEIEGSTKLLRSQTAGQNVIPTDASGNVPIAHKGGVIR